MTLIALFGITSLAALLYVARLVDERRQRGLEAHARDLLSPHAGQALRRLELQLGDLGLGVALGDAAVREHDRRVLTAAVMAVELHAPSLREGLRALSLVARTVSVLVAPPPVPPRAWRSGRIKALAAAALLAHGLLVTGAERVRVRVWLLGRAFGLAAQAFTRSAGAVDVQPRAWDSAAVALEDLATVHQEVGVTYERVVRNLDALGRLALAG